MRSILIFLATAGLTTYCLSLLLPPVTLRAFELKLAAYAERESEIDLLFLGTSQTFHGVEPALFDARTAERGVATKSFNLGIPAAGLAEQYAYLRQVAELRPKHLRWILVEAERVRRVGVEEDGPFLTPKAIGTTDPTTAAMLWTYFGEVESRPWRLYPARWRTLVTTAYHVAGVGRGLPWIDEALGRGASDEDRSRALGPLGDGYRCLEGEMDPIEERPARYALKKRQFERRVRQVEAAGDRPEPPHPSALPFYRRIEELGRSMGARVVFFTIRRGAGESDAPAFARQGEIDTLIRFDDPDRFPELYDVDMTVDGGHLNAAGAEAFTRYLADAFVEVARSRAP